MVFAIPEDILCNILDNVPVVARLANEPKQGWESFQGFSLASRHFRQLALGRWFRTLALHEEEDWEYLYTHAWIIPLVRELRCSGQAWERCYTRTDDSELPLGFVKIGLKNVTQQTLAEFFRLDTVFCDMSSVHSRTGYVEAELLDTFSRFLPRTVDSMKLLHSPVLPVATLVNIIQNLPNLRSLDLGSCKVHCTCSLCPETALIHDLTNTMALGVYLSHSRRFDFVRLATQVKPPPEHLQEISFNVHLTQPSEIIAHRRDHDRTLSVAECPRCPAAVAQLTLEKERKAVLAFANSFPSLKKVVWCSWFCKNGRRAFSIHRDEAGTGSEVSLEEDV
ncbi:hypothetical protein K439DRAFT_870683 [Ramaria rubella]|nr:hypothetical protein K439DRAFT_870683 [Ramaria rubella]